jgi:hypothetical protein
MTSRKLSAISCQLLAFSQCFIGFVFDFLTWLIEVGFLWKSGALAPRKGDLIRGALAPVLEKDVPPLTGLSFSTLRSPGLTPWAITCRRYTAAAEE